MRQVIRTAEPDCLKTANIPADAITVIQGGGRAKKIYRNEPVKSALKAMYLDKCFLCEKKIGDGEWDIDHFVPYHAANPAIAYVWTNLNWCCKPCNQRKRDEKYRERDALTRADVRTKLIDPSNPSPLPVRQMIRFDNRVRAITGTDPRCTVDTVEKTIELLNEKARLSNREANQDALDDFLHARKCPQVEWEDIINSKKFDPDQWTDSYFEAFKDAFDFWEIYLDARAPYSACMRDYFQLKHRINYLDLMLVAESYQVRNSIPLVLRSD